MQRAPWDLAGGAGVVNLTTEIKMAEEASTQVFDRRWLAPDCLGSDPRASPLASVSSVYSVK
jgi:hypothetical protein